MACAAQEHILAINAGSSSIKLALYPCGPEMTAVLTGAIRDIGSSHSSFEVNGTGGGNVDRRLAIADHVTAVNVLIAWLLERIPPASIAAIAHRVVYGGVVDAATQPIDASLLGSLYAAASSEPDHLPQQLYLTEQLRRHFRDSVHVACFDSGFHRTMPAVAAMLPIPRRYYEQGVRRHGFHGLSCAYLMHSLGLAAGPEAAAGKVVIAHLGGGASVTAVENGCSRDTSMGLTPAGGIMMGTRSGDLDPGLAWHLARSERMSQSGFHHMVNQRSGLLGVSGTSADLRELLARCAADSPAAEAVDMFCYQVRKAVCAMAGALGGVDTLIFSGGVGEHAAEVRARVCASLAHLGVMLDPARNVAGAPVISSASSVACVRVMGTDEQWVMAEQTRALLAAQEGARTEEACHD